jgi:PncC family amidohydrolase
MEELVELLKQKNLTLSCVESLTGGLFASSITNIPGVSKVFKGGVVTYWTSIKEDVVHVNKDIIDKFGVVSSECALEMARHGQELLTSDICISFTGNAGPDVMENKPVGLVYIGLKIKDKEFVKELHLQGNRQEIRKKCIQEGCNLIFEKIF